MKLKTINSSKEYKWNKHFLWLPKKVRLCKSKDSAYHEPIMGLAEFEYCWLWLETVERKNVRDSLDTDDGKFIYWKELE